MNDGPPGMLVESTDDLQDGLVEVEEDVLYACPMCAESTIHDLLGEKNIGKGVNIRAQCTSCNSVHVIELRPPPARNIRVILSDDRTSTRSTIEVDIDEELFVRDEFGLDGKRWEITRIEIPSGDVQKAVAHEIRSLWARRTDIARVRVTFTDYDHSESEVWVVDPDDVFEADAPIETDRGTWWVRAIHSGRGRILGGKMKARKVRRLFLHRLPREKRVA